MVTVQTQQLIASLAREELAGRVPAGRARGRGVVETDGFETVMFEVFESRIELLGATGPESKLTGLLAKRGGGIHHVAYGVEDVQASLEDLASMGMRLLDGRPRKGAGGKLVGFVHPKSASGVLTELCQDDPAAAGHGG